MRATISGDIRITDATAHELQQIAEHLSIDDPSYHQKIRINPRLRYSMQPQFRYYEKEKDGAIRVPRGAGKWLQETFKNISWKDETVETAHSGWLGKEAIKLRENQSGIPETLARHRQGLCVLPTGFGKTVIALETARLLGQHTLILVPRKNIQDQFINDAKTFFGIDATKPESPIKVYTPALVLSRLRKKSFDPRAFGAVFFDECHSAVASGTRQIFKSLHARYRFGLTGTLDRSDGQGGAIPFYFGETLVERSQTLLAPRVVIHEYQGGGAVEDYHLIAEHLGQDEDRNKEIVNLVQKGRRTLILTKRVEHYEILRNLLPKDLDAFALSSKDNTSGLLDAMRKGTQKFDVLLGTFSLLATGLDIPSLDTLIIAGDLKSTVLQRQSVGRILRLFKDNKDPVVHDIADISNPILRNHAKLRRKAYESLSWQVTICKMKKMQAEIFPKHIQELLQRLATESANQ